MIYTYKQREKIMSIGSLLPFILEPAYESDKLLRLTTSFVKVEKII